MNHSNTEIKRWCDNRLGIDVKCPCCGETDRFFVYADWLRPKNILTKEVAEELSVLEANQMVLDFEKDHLRPVNAEGREIPALKRDTQVAGYKPGDVYDGAGTLIAHVE
ncbi:MAG: hypothetical protein WC517_05045 [Patescibacteria group bacterium]